MIGQTVPHYRVLRKLGGGGMGVVYEAENQWPFSQKQYALHAENHYAQVLAARAYAAQGDKTKAREMYQDVLAAWKNSDPGLQLVERVKAEYAKLQ